MISDTTENWDDDFEFQPDRNATIIEGRFLLNGDSTTPLSRDKTNTVTADLTLHQWAEAGPSTPSKQRPALTENWDDDFQDNSESPVRHRVIDGSPRTRRVKARQLPPEPEPENWDDDFQDGKQMSPSGKSARWDSSDDEDDLGFADREEDRTVTSRSRRGALSSVLPNETPPPPVPPIPSAFMDSSNDPAPFPRSPTASLFSVPVSGRESVAGQSYSSTAHLALRPTLSGSSFGAIPPSPPTHHARERRRLRKKSRPARVEDNIYELEDTPPRPVTPERSAPSQGVPSVEDPLPDATPSSAGRSSLVSRIGSVGKKWGASRKKRDSTGPIDIPDREAGRTSRPQSMALPSSPPISKGGWFFRQGGAAGVGSGSPPDQLTSTLPLRHEKSVDKLLAFVGFDHPDTPSKRKWKIRQGLPSDLASTDNASFSGNSPYNGSPRRPTSMQFSASSRSSSRPAGSRHASYGQASGRQTPSSRSSSAAHSTSASVDDVCTNNHRRIALVGVQDEDGNTPRKGRRSPERDTGSKSLVSGVRRPSLHSTHGRTQNNSPGPDSDPARPSTSTAATAVPVLPLDFSHDTTPRPPSRVLGRPSLDKSLLPPIELQPPSPPREVAGLTASLSEPASGPLGIDFSLAPLPSSTSLPNTSAQSAQPKLPSSPPQSASLGRSAHPPKEREDVNALVPRRNSLGDLKIPARISQAQMGLRRDLEFVREFAASVERLKEIRVTYNLLILEIQTLLIDTVPPEEPRARAMSPTLFGLPRPGRTRASTNPQTSVHSNQAAIHRHLATTYRVIEAKYRMSWECAELLVELGGGPPAGQETSTPILPSLEQSTSTITPSTMFLHDTRKSRERAITLAGDESKPQLPIWAPSSGPLSSAPTAQWRASTGRHDLSQRQLSLLRDMLSNTDSSTAILESHIPEETINRNWRWDDPTSSTVTLPSEESSHHGSNIGLAGAQSPIKKRKSIRLGMRGIRDMLKTLRKTYSQSQTQIRPRPPVDHISPPTDPPSSTSVSVGTGSSLNLPREKSDSVVQRRRAKTSSGPDLVGSLRDTHPNSPYVISSSVTHRSSPRRPSLASIFRLGQKHGKASSSKSSPQSNGGHELSMEDVDRMGSTSSCQISTSTHPEEEDWDKVESSSELAAVEHTVATGNYATVRGAKGHSPYSLDNQGPFTPNKETLNASRSSVWEPPSSQTPARSLQSPSSTSIPYSRSTKLSDVREQAEKEARAPVQREHRRSLSKNKKRSSMAPSPSPKRPISRGGRKSAGTGSLRSAAPPILSSPASIHTHTVDEPALPDTHLSLAMTPENIGPLLENAKEVHARCNDCIEELKQLLPARTSFSLGP